MMEFLFRRDIPRNYTKHFFVSFYLLHLFYSGNINATFCLPVLYLVLLFTMRFLIEFVKEVQVGWENKIDLKMGQSLSIPFVVLGVAAMFFSYWKRKKQIKHSTQVPLEKIDKVD